MPRDISFQYPAAHLYRTNSPIKAIAAPLGTSPRSRRDPVTQSPGVRWLMGWCIHTIWPDGTARCLRLPKFVPAGKMGVLLSMRPCPPPPPDGSATELPCGHT